METKRVTLVIVGLVVAGGIAGGIASASAVAVAGMLGADSQSLHHTMNLSTLPDERVDLVAAGWRIGVAAGVLLGPLAAWLLMRRVPLGIAIGGTMLGTFDGEVAALVLGTHYFTLPLAGFALSALMIRFAVARRARARVEG
jgi:hypothetical protein